MTKLFIGSLVIGGAGIIFIYNIKNIKNSMKYNVVDSSTQTEPVIIKYDVENRRIRNLNQSLQQMILLQ